MIGRGAGARMVRQSTAIFSVLVAAAMAAAGQEHGEDRVGARTFRDAVDVIEVTVPVWVFRNGRPVTGLTAEDFLLFDRGKRQEIIGFAVQDRTGSEHLATTPVDDVATDPSVRRLDATVAPTDPPLRRNFVALFDMHRLTGQNAARAVEALRERFERPLPPGDAWAVVLHGVVIPGDRNKSARLVTGFTADRELLTRGLDAVQALADARRDEARAILVELSSGAVDAALRGEEATGISGLSRPAALMLRAARAKRSRKTLSLETGIPLGWLGIDAPQNMVRDAAEGWIKKSSKIRVSDGSPAARLRWFTLAMADLVTFLRDVPGENHLVLLSPGGYGPLSDTYTTGRIRPMLAAFRRYGWTFQAIDVTGRGFRGSDMFYMANETGGTLIENVRDIAIGLDKVAERTSITYLLTFRPSKQKADGKLHKLEVKLADKSLADRIKHREGYYAPSAHGGADALGDHLDVMAAVFGDQEIRDIAVAVAVGEATRANDRYRLAVAVAVDSTTLLVGQREPLLNVKIEGYVLDTGGGVVDLFAEETTIDLARVDFLRGNRLRLQREVVLPTGEHRLRVWVENVDTGKASLTTTPIVVPSRP